MELSNATLETINLEEYLAVTISAVSSILENPADLHQVNAFVHIVAMELLVSA